MAAGDELLGVLTLNLKRGRLPEGNDREMLHSFASQAAVAMRNARLFADNARLCEEAQQRVHELQATQAQLVQAAKLSAVGQLVSGVAHELNNPLSVLIGYGQLLLSRGVPDEAVRPIEASIRLETELDAAVPPVRGDAHQLRQVFLNVVLNAEQAILGSGVGARHSGDCIRVSTSARFDGDRTWVVAQVVDNGPGIPAEVLPRIFEPFFTTKKIGQGVGLGLSVSYGIVEQHGGRLSVESRPAHSVFTLELPAAAPQEAPAPAVSSGSPASGA